MNAEQTPDEVVARNIRTFTRFQQEVIVGGDFSAFSELVAPDAVTLQIGRAHV